MRGCTAGKFMNSGDFTNLVDFLVFGRSKKQNPLCPLSLSAVVKDRTVGDQPPESFGGTVLSACWHDFSK